MSLATPVLLIAWRRPNLLRQVIDAIRPVAPKQMFVACDGPHIERPGEAEKVAATRAVIESQIDWPCQIQHLYSDNNQGCLLGPFRAINWFFHHVEQGIILEDDCLPDVDFFAYCEWALNQFVANKRVMHINGNNFGARPDLYRETIDFVSLAQVWGWATWADRWRKVEMNPFYIGESLNRDSWRMSWAARLLKQNHVTCLQKGLDTWDYQWQIAVLQNQGLVVSPRNNLVSNLGSGEDASHTINDSKRMRIRVGSFCLPTSIPALLVNKRLNLFYEKNMGLGLSLTCLILLIKHLSKYLKIVLKYLLMNLLFFNVTPIIVASTGRSGSTMLVKAVSHSLVVHRFYWAPPSIRRILENLAVQYVDRLGDLKGLCLSPVVKTHSLFASNSKKAKKYIFVFGDPLESAISAEEQGKKHGRVWLEEHIYHLQGSGSPEDLYTSDVLNYEHQILSWRNSPALKVHYSEIWSRQSDLSRFLGFSLLLPVWRKREADKKNLPADYSFSLFSRLKALESSLLAEERMPNGRPLGSRS